MELHKFSWENLLALIVHYEVYYLLTFRCFSELNVIDEHKKLITDLDRGWLNLLPAFLAFRLELHPNPEIDCTLPNSCGIFLVPCTPCLRRTRPILQGFSLFLFAEDTNMLSEAAQKHNFWGQNLLFLLNLNSFSGRICSFDLWFCRR